MIAFTDSRLDLPETCFLAGPTPDRHAGRYSVSGCDGHVEAIRPRLLFNLTNTAPRWNRDNKPHPETW